MGKPKDGNVGSDQEKKQLEYHQNKRNPLHAAELR